MNRSAKLTASTAIPILVTLTIYFLTPSIQTSWESWEDLEPAVFASSSWLLWAISLLVWKSYLCRRGYDPDRIYIVTSIAVQVSLGSIFSLPHSLWIADTAGKSAESQMGRTVFDPTLPIIVGSLLIAIGCRIFSTTAWRPH